MRAPKCLLLFLLFSSVFLFSNLYASEPVQRPDIIKDAEIVSVQGDGWVRFIKEQNWLDAVRRQILTAGDSLKTGPYGRMSILFIDDTQIKVHNKTTILIKEVRTSSEKGRTVLGLEVGEIWSSQGDFLRRFMDILEVIQDGSMPFVIDLSSLPMLRKNTPCPRL